MRGSAKIGNALGVKRRTSADQSLSYWCGWRSGSRSSASRSWRTSHCIDRNSRPGYFDRTHTYRRELVGRWFEFRDL